MGRRGVLLDDEHTGTDAADGELLVALDAGIAELARHDARASGAPAEESDQLLDRGGGPLGVDRRRAVGFVSNPAHHAESSRARRRVASRYPTPCTEPRPHPGLPDCWSLLRSDSAFHRVPKIAHRNRSGRMRPSDRVLIGCERLAPSVRLPKTFNRRRPHGKHASFTDLSRRARPDSDRPGSAGLRLSHAGRHLQSKGRPIPGFPGTGNIKGAGAAVQAEYTISGTEYGGYPPPVEGINFYLPRQRPAPAGFPGIFCAWLVRLAVVGSGRILTPNISGAMRIADARANDALYPARWVAYMRNLVGRKTKIPTRDADSPFLDAAGVRYLLLPPGAQPSRPGFQLVYRSRRGSHSPDVWRNSHAYPKAWIPRSIVAVRTKPVRCAPCGLPLVPTCGPSPSWRTPRRPCGRHRGPAPRPSSTSGGTT